MHDVRASVREIASNLPDDADWDRVWTSIVSNFGHVATEVNNPCHRLEAIIGSMSDIADWDDIWDAVIAESHRKSVYQVETIAEQVPNRASVQSEGGRGTGLPGPATQTTIREHASAQGLAANEVTSQSLWWKSNHNSTQLRRKGLFLRNLSYGIGVGGMLLLGWWDSMQYEGGYSGTTLVRILYIVVFFSAFAIVFKLVVTLHRASRALIQRSEEEAMTQDTRPPVVYLRSFQADETMRDSPGLGHTEEEQWSNVLRDIGPVIALAAPLGNELSPGATRLQTDDNNWQQVVESYLATAALTVIRLGNSESLKWEINKAIELVKPERLIFLVPNRNEFNFREFQVYIGTLLGTNVPNLKKENILVKIGLRIPLTQKITDYLSIEAILLFDNEGRPSLQEIPIGFVYFLRSPLKSSLAGSIKFAMKPVFENLGITWKKPTLRPGPVLATLVIGAGTVFGILETIMK